MKTFVNLISLIIGITPIVTLAQNIPVPTDKTIVIQHERPDNKYLPNPFANKKTAPSRANGNTAVFTSQVNVNSNGENILGDAANEPSIAVDPSNPARIVIGWRQFDNVYSNFRQAGYAYTSDSGQTWTFPGELEAGIFRSDPVLNSDASGNFYYNSLTYDNGSGLYLCKVFKSASGGVSWNSGTDAHGGDKQWMTTDKSGGVGMGNLYSVWNPYYSSCAPWYMTRSATGGNSFEDCVFVDGNPYWGTMTVGKQGELYIAGSAQANGIVVAKSTNAKTPGSTISWDFTSFAYMDGYISGSFPINPLGILGQAYIDVDRSNGAGSGNVYVLASMPRISNNDSADVMFSRSDDGGLNWSDPIRVNDDPGTDRFQWFGTMSVAPNGRIDAAWLDTRDAPAGFYLSALYYSYSTDQGTTWSANEKLSALFDPHIGYPQQEKMGDYFDMVSDNNGAHLAWANTLNGEEDVYYSHIIPDITGINEKTNNRINISLFNYPNPFHDLTTISYKIITESSIRIEIYNIYGEKVRELINKSQRAGSYEISFSDKLLPSGFYFCSLTAGKIKKTIRMVKI